MLNLYQVLRRKQLNVSDIKSGYIFVSAEQFENQEKAQAIYEAFQSDTHQTLIIDCSCKYDRSVADVLATLNSFSDKRKIIFMAVTDVAESLQDKLKKYQAKIMYDRDYTWSDLTTDSQNELLKTAVSFQGSAVSLNELISAKSPVAKFLPLADLLERKTLEIGKHLLTSTADGCIENYYIPRTFNHQVAIKKDILGKELSDLVATNEQEFRQFCQDNLERNVHWLLEDKSGRLIWQQSQGSVRALHEYIDTQNSLPYTPENLDKFLQQAQCQKVMLISDTAGMGKTTVLTHLSKQMKQKFPTYWVVKIDLNDHTDVLEAQMKQKIGTDEFLSGKLLELHHPFEKELFKQCCQGLEEASKVVLMFDGFDDMSPKYQQTVLDLLEDLNPLKQPWIEQLWVTTRPHLRVELEDNLQQLCYTLEPFSKDNQVGFLTKFWHQHLKLEKGNQQQLETYARVLIEKLAQSVSDKEKEFTGIPLQTQMLAETFEEEVKMFCLSQKSEPVLAKQLCHVDLYRKCIENKWNIFIQRGEIAKEQHTHSVFHDISVTKTHQKLALEIVFPELKDVVLKLEEPDMLAPEAISRIGIVQYIDDKPHFIHHTFAEYYVADFLVTQLTGETCFLLEVLNILFKILLGAAYRVIRFFVAGLLLKHEQPEVKERYGKQMYKIWNEKKETQLRILHQAAAEGNDGIIDFFFSNLKASGHSDTVNKLLVHKDSYEGNAWLVAAENGNKEVLEKLWGWGREVQVSLKDDLLLAKNVFGKIAWHMAAQNGNKEILEQLWGFGREVQVNLKDDLLLARDYYSETAWNIAADNGYKEILEKLWGWGREVQVNLKDDFLLAKGCVGLTAWDIAAEKACNKEILEMLWSMGREVQVNLKDDLLLAKDVDGRTAWHRAVEKDNKEIIEKLWFWGRKVQANLKDDLLLTRGYDGRTAWDIAARNGNRELLETLWCWGREVKVNLKDDLLLSKGYFRRTAWDIAAKNGNEGILEKLWGWGREVQVNMKCDLLLSKGFNGLTAWHLAAEKGNKEILKKLLLWNREVQV
jgi:ankyrin repeat protein